MCSWLDSSEWLCVALVITGALLLAVSIGYACGVVDGRRAARTRLPKRQGSDTQ